jgi:hypothetical protein
MFNLKRMKQLNNERLEELSESLSEFSEKAVSLNWHTKSKSSGIMNIESFDSYYEMTHLYICEDECPVMYVPIKHIVNFVRELDRLILKTTDMIYIIETA